MLNEASPIQIYAACILGKKNVYACEDNMPSIFEDTLPLEWRKIVIRKKEEACYFNDS